MKQAGDKRIRMPPDKFGELVMDYIRLNLSNSKYGTQYLQRYDLPCYNRKPFIDCPSRVPHLWT